MNQDTAMIEILGKIISRLVNVALFIIITILALVFIREGADMNLALIALISIMIGIVGTIVLRYLLKLVLRIGNLFSPDQHQPPES
ncbi:MULTISPECIES: hypothetical protein [unclassified Brevibacterium]|uniref:hypothetical protein n=1 Tax=unclassified Brevibacterium TaxID=2614124 RepID=UPI00299F876A|nr:MULTISPECIES: hypothetical protein [unclassified Brevibacterium]